MVLPWRDHDEKMEEDLNPLFFWLQPNCALDHFILNLALTLIWLEKVRNAIYKINDIILIKVITNDSLENTLNQVIVNLHLRK